MSSNFKITSNYRSSGMLPTELRRGFDSICLRIKQDEDVLPPSELSENYRLKRVSLNEERERVWLLIHSGNQVSKKNFKRKWKNRIMEHPQYALVSLWFEIGEKIREVELSLNRINDKLHEGREIEFSRIFMGVTRSLVDKDTYNEILVHTERLKSMGFTGTQKEWAKFVESVE